MEFSYLCMKEEEDGKVKTLLLESTYSALLSLEAYLLALKLQVQHHFFFKSFHSQRVEASEVAAVRVEEDSYQRRRTEVVFAD